MYTLFTAGVTLWLAYGVIQRSWPLVGANAVTFLLALIVLIMRLRYGARQAG
jgi:MtN3 and saliva related transmembrane protein